MPLAQFRNIAGSAATAAVLCYSYLGAPLINPIVFVDPNIQITAPDELNYDHYQLVQKEQSVALAQIDTIHKFATNLLDNIEDLDPEFSQTVDDNFWDLI